MSKTRKFFIYAKKVILKAVGVGMLGVLSVAGFDGISNDLIPGLEIERDALVSAFIAGAGGVMIPASRKVFEDIAEDGDLDLSYYNTPFEEDLDDLDYEDDQIIAEGYEDDDLDDFIPTLDDDVDRQVLVRESELNKVQLDEGVVDAIRKEVERLIPSSVIEEQQPLPNIG